jgi:hypothetical protein
MSIRVAQEPDVAFAGVDMHIEVRTPAPSQTVHRFPELAPHRRSW